ncbi:MAG: hypothetical protein KTR31_09170 [Myxococcales bacterium]|nr:hypothetical protein [Myxococcales bacterium]
MIVVGRGRIGSALARRGAAVGTPVTGIGRDDGWEALDAAAGDPVLVAVRNDDLAAVVERTPTHRRPDLVFLQNGAIRELLADLSVASCTRGLLYFLASDRTSPVVEGMDSWFCGPHAQAVAAWLARAGLAAQAVDWARFSYYELEKLLWLACHGLLCEAHQATVGEVAAQHKRELHALVEELVEVGQITWGVSAPVPYMVDRMVQYSALIPDYRASVKEWSTRNGWLRDRARHFGLAIPRHEALLRATGHHPG